MVSLFDIFERTCVPECTGYDPDDPFLCESCQNSIVEAECYMECQGSKICVKCYSDEEQRVGEAYPRIPDAVAMCRITGEFPVYDQSLEFKPTRDEYEMGNRTSYSPRAYDCHCRHNCTNYDELIRTLGKHDAADQVVYRAVRDRIDDLVNEGIKRSNTREVAASIRADTRSFASF